MAYGYDDPALGTQPRVQKSGGGWKLLLALMFCAAGLGFAGYVYLVPYRKMSLAVGARTAELGEERSTAEQMASERDKLKAELARRDATDKDRAASQGKRVASAEALATEMKTALGELGASVAAADGKVAVSFPVPSVFEQPTSTALSPQGQAAIKILAGVTKKGDFRARVKARLIGAAPPKELSQFRNIGEFAMLRAARIALALVEGGVAPTRVAAAGDAPPAAGRKGKVALPDRLDIEIEPE